MGVGSCSVVQLFSFVMRADVLTGLRRTPPPLRGTPSERGKEGEGEEKTMWMSEYSEGICIFAVGII